jgi:hypothetical protein
MRNKNPKKDCRPGSIERDLDMCEGPAFRSEDILHGNKAHSERGPLGAGFRVDESEGKREGAEESGDEHSAGYQGDEPELINQDNVDSGLPGALTEEEEREQRKNEGEAA